MAISRGGFAANAIVVSVSGLALLCAVGLASWISTSAVFPPALDSLSGKLPGFVDTSREIWYHGPLPHLSLAASAVWHGLYAHVLQAKLFWLLVLGLVAWKAYWNWQEFLDLGQGGTKLTPYGWFNAHKLALFAWVDIFKAPRIPPHWTTHRRGRLWIPASRGPVRPTIKGIAPQRQIDQRGSPSVYFAVEDMLRRYADDHPRQLEFRAQSFMEHTVPALHRRLGHDKVGALALDTPDEFAGEIAHGHRADGSLHVVLHPDDCQTIIDAGWGERSRIAGRNPFTRWYHHRVWGVRLPVPETMMLIYAPRHAGELEVVTAIIESAIWFATGGEVFAVNKDTYPLPAAPLPLADQSAK